MGYWEDRQSETLDAILANAEISADEIADIYAKSSFVINEKIQGIFDRYRAKYDLSIQEATELLNHLEDSASFDEMLNILGSSKGDEKRELLKKLEAPAYRYRINRFQELQKAIDDMMANIYSQEKDISTAHYIDTAHESYYRTTYNLQHDIGYEYDFASVDSKKVDKLLKNRWSGANYSERIWNNTQTLADELKENLLLGMLTGMSEREMRDRLTERFQVSNFKARRLIETESAYISTMMDMEAYKEADVDTLRFIAIHDFKTSKICRSLDCTYVKLNEAVAGKNVPPMHPHCRSRTEPVIDEEFDKNMKRRVKDPITGEYKIVQGHETYDQWYERTVKEQGKDTVETLEKKIKNKHSDKNQYERYKDILGKENVPDSFDKFQEMKYNDKEEWSLMKKYKKSRSNGKLSAFSTFDDYRKYRDIIQNDIVGLNTSDGIKITSQSDHFIERVLGTTVKEGPKKDKKREGVSIESIYDALINTLEYSQKVTSNGNSRKYIGNDVEVTLNPDTGKLIQVNPRKKGK